MAQLQQTGQRRVAPGRKRQSSAISRLWRRVRRPIVESAAFKNALAWVLYVSILGIKRTNRVATGSDDLEAFLRANPRTIYALWHGQHLLAPAYNPRWHRVVAMFSRSADAELNALVAHRFGLETVRGSGGRVADRARAAEKGGAPALIALKRALDQGRSVCMIADVPHGEARQAGLGVVTLARISGRPVVPMALATTRRKVLERTWDRTTINLPFGRYGLAIGAPVAVPADADDAELERCRVALTDSLNEATARAYEMVDGKA